MRTLLFLIQKEFIQISRDKFMRVAIIVIPIVQMMVLVYAANFEMKNIHIHFVDQDKSTASSNLIQKFTSAVIASMGKNVLEGDILQKTVKLFKRIIPSLDIRPDGVSISAKSLVEFQDSSCLHTRN